MSLLLWIGILIGTIISLIALFSHLFYCVSGVWERIDCCSQTNIKERIRFAQFGCLIIGKRIVVGGFQSFFGFSIGQHIWLKRRDYGVESLTRGGFPIAIARKVEGSTMGRYRLQLSEDQNLLFGDFMPVRIEFCAKENKVTSISRQAPQARQYKRIEAIAEPSSQAIAT